MTKEEYLSNYKEEKLAEICENLEKDNKRLDTERVNLIIKLNIANKDKEVFENMDKLYEKIKKLPADDFMNLFYKMKVIVSEPQYNTSFFKETISTSIKC